MQNLASILAGMQPGALPGIIPSGTMPTAGGAFQQMPTGGGPPAGLAAVIAALQRAAPSSSQMPMGGAPTVNMSQMPTGGVLPGGGGAVPQMPLGLGILPR